jgi:hypothetical protein
MTYIKVHFQHLFRRTMEHHGKPCQNSQSPGKDLKSGPHKFEGRSGTTVNDVRFMTRVYMKKRKDCDEGKA